MLSLSQMQLWSISHIRHSRFIIITMIITIITNCTDLWCYNWFLFKLFQTPRDREHGWHISNEQNTVVWLDKRTTCPHWYLFYLGICCDKSFSQKSVHFRQLAPIYWNWFWCSCARIVFIFLAEPFRSECSPVAWCRRFDASRWGRTWSVIIAPRVITRTLQCNHTCCRCNVITYKHDFSEFVCL